jgi:hypothetical protein
MTKANSKFGIGSVFDTMDFMRKAWGGLSQMPGSLQPTLDVDEIDKRIADLKAVEQWLNLNMGMLRGTIQGLEVQRATITAMSSLGKSVLPDPMNKAMGQAISQSVEAAANVVGKTRAARKKVGTVVDAASTANAWWNGLQKQFNDVTGAALSGGLSNNPKPRKVAARKVAARKAKK